MVNDPYGRCKEADSPGPTGPHDACDRAGHPESADAASDPVDTARTVVLCTLNMKMKEKQTWVFSNLAPSIKECKPKA